MIWKANRGRAAQGDGVLPRKRVRFLVALAALLWSAAAAAQVTLEHDVRKVETTLEADGRVKRELMPVEEVVPGEELRYTVTFTNDSDTVVDAERIVVTVPLPDGTAYLPGTAGGDAARVEYSSDGESFNALEHGEPAGPRPDGRARPPADAGPDEQAGDPSVRALRWTYRQDLAPGDSSMVFFHVRMQ